MPACRSASSPRTLTEYGIVGKIGVNSAGLGLLFNILHHAADGAGGTPVHALARHALAWVTDEVIEWQHPSGTWYRYRPFHDPDGNMVYVTEPHKAAVLA